MPDLIGHLQVFHRLPVRQGVVDFATRAGADITVDVDDVDTVSHVDFALVHVVEHLLGPFGPYFVVAAVAEQADADDDVARESQALLRLQELLLEARAAAEGYDEVFADHEEDSLALHN